MARNAVAYEAPKGSGAWDLAEMKPGAYIFIWRNNKHAGIAHNCPCGCGMVGSLGFRGMTGDAKHEWDISGEWPNVTLSPSIGIHGIGLGQYHWHGYLENGVFVER